MKKFLAVYLGTPEAVGNWNKLTDAQRKEREQQGMKAWGEWMTRHSKMVIDTGGPLGKTKRVSKQGVQDARNDMTGYVIIEAESHEAAARLFEQHPHFTLFPGQAVDVMECLPIPGR
jgi:hypothetical protein